MKRGSPRRPASSRRGTPHDEDEGATWYKSGKLSAFPAFVGCRSSNATGNRQGGGKP